MNKNSVNLKFVVQSPIHIGSGYKINPIEYVVENNSFYRLDMEGVFGDLEFKRKRNEFISFASESQRAGQKQPYFGAFDKELGLKHVSYRLLVHDRPNGDFGGRNTPEVSEFIKTSGKFYVPGSSIKGAILSALYWHTLKNSGEKSLIKKQLSEPHMRYDERGISSEIKRIVFSSLIKESSMSKFGRNIEFAPWLQVSDTNGVSTENAFVGVCIVSGGKSELALYSEFLKPEVSLDFSMRVEENSRFSLEEILKITDEFYSCVLGNPPAKTLGEYKIFVGRGSSSLATSLRILAEDLGVKDEYLKYWKLREDGKEPVSQYCVSLGREKKPAGLAKITRDE